MISKLPSATHRLAGEALQENLPGSSVSIALLSSVFPEQPGRTALSIPSPKMSEICRRCQSLITQASQFGRSISAVGTDDGIDISHNKRSCTVCDALMSKKEVQVQFTEVDLTGRHSKYMFWGSSTRRLSRVIKLDHQEENAYIQQNPWGDTWPRDPSKVDTKFLKEALAHCRQFHGNVCNVKPRAPIDGLQLFNCKERIVCDAGPDAEYIALSYVWGSAGGRSLPTATPTKLQRTIEDAINVVTNFGYTYLWVDQLCINQSAAHRDSQLRQMNRIYQNADMTIIAAAGENSSYGLPGWGYSNRNPQRYFQIGDVQYMEDKPCPWDIVDRSTWASRGWTLQEWILSRRKVVFTEREAWFCCRLIEPVKDGNGLESRQFNPDHGTTPDDESLIRPSHWIDSNDPRKITSILSNYAKRSLTFPSDALNAVAGVLQAFQDLENPLLSHWGIPIFPRVGRPVWKTNNRLTSLECKRNTTSEGFLLGLCWQLGGLHWKHTSPANIHISRRLNYPSWSWAGWSDHSESELDSNGLKWPYLSAEPGQWEQSMLATPYAELNDRKMVSLDEFVGLSTKSGSSQVSYFLWLEAWTITLELRNCSAFKSDAGCIHVLQLEDSTRSPGLGNSIHLTYRNLVIESFQESVFSSRKATLTGILLGDWYVNDNLCFPILMVEEKQGFAERVGLLTVQFSLPPVDSAERLEWEKSQIMFKTVNRSATRRKLRLG